MTVYCMAPEPIFWDRLRSTPGYEQVVPILCEQLNVDPAAPDLEHQIYVRYTEYLRRIGQLCDHPDHQPPEFKVH